MTTMPTGVDREVDVTMNVDCYLFCKYLDNVLYGVLLACQCAPDNQALWLTAGLACMHPREGAPIFVLLEREVPKKSTEVPMMTTRFTTLQTPCETGLTRDRVLKANCTQQPSSQHPNAEESHTMQILVML